MIAVLVIICTILFLLCVLLFNTIRNIFWVQLKYIQIYMSDNTEEEFYNKSKDEAITFGQDQLWESVDKFHTSIDAVTKQKKPLLNNDLTILYNAIRIVKIAQAMAYIEKNGPIFVTDDEEAQNKRAADLRSN